MDNTFRIGDKVTVTGWGRQLDGKTFIIWDIRYNVRNCGTGTLVMIDGYPNWLDSAWLTKLNELTIPFK